MELQQEISDAKNDALIGTTQKVIIDRVEGDQFVGEQNAMRGNRQ